MFRLTKPNYKLKTSILFLCVYRSLYSPCRRGASTDDIECAGTLLQYVLFLHKFDVIANRTTIKTNSEIVIQFNWVDYMVLLNEVAGPMDAEQERGERKPR